MKEQTPLYTYPGLYASEHGEQEQYRASYRANISCKEAIEQSIAGHYGNNRLDPACVEPVIKQFGYERVFYVLANTVRQRTLTDAFHAIIRHGRKQFQSVRIWTALAVTGIFILLWTNAIPA